MKLINRLCYLLFAGALLATAAGATTIIQTPGNSSASVPLGYYPPYAPYNLTPIVFAVGWTQTSDYTNVDVTANLFSPGSPGTVNYELVTALGPGTTFAADGIVRGTDTTPTNPADVILFQLASLKAGTYYLVLDSTTAAWQYNFPGSTTTTTAGGVTFLGDQWSTGSAINAAYTPSSPFSGNNFPVQFSVQGTVASPEPATFAGTGLALAGLSMFLRRRIAKQVRSPEWRRPRGGR